MLEDCTSWACQSDGGSMHPLAADLPHDAVGWIELWLRITNAGKTRQLEEHEWAVRSVRCRPMDGFWDVILQTGDF